jgi:hypothetical protein
MEELEIQLVVLWKNVMSIELLSTWYHEVTIKTILIRGLFNSDTSYLITLFVTSNHQTTNLVFPNFFNEFFSVWSVEEENKLFIGPKLRKNLFWTNKKFVFLFRLLN